MTQPRSPEDLAEQYGEEYYRYYSRGDPPYLPGEKHWESFFEYVAECIVAELAPKKVLDAGCAVGFLVSSLRRMGVEASGIDISEYAVSNASEDVRPYLKVASVTDDLDDTYDLILCIEVLEHLPNADAQRAVANLCRHTDSVLFSSTSTDFADPTHLNVQPSEYWAELFARWGLFRDVDLDASFLAPYAVHFHRSDRSPVGVAREYERWHSRTAGELAELRIERRRYESSAQRVGELEQRARSLDEDVRVLEANLKEAQAQLLRAGVELEHLSALADAREVQRQEASMRAQLAESELEALRSTRTFRYLAPLRRVWSRLRPHLRL